MFCVNLDFLFLILCLSVLSSCQEGSLAVPLPLLPLPSRLSFVVTYFWKPPPMSLAGSVPHSPWELVLAVSYCVIYLCACLLLLQGENLSWLSRLHTPVAAQGWPCNGELVNVHQHDLI